MTEGVQEVILPQPAGELCVCVERGERPVTDRNEYDGGGTGSHSPTASR